MAVLTVQPVNHTGVTTTYAACAGGGDDAPNDGRTILHVKNGSGGSLNVTVDQKTKCSHNFDHNVVVAVGAGSEKMFGPFGMHDFNDANGRINITYSGVTSLTIAAIKITETGR